MMFCELVMDYFDIRVEKIGGTVNEKRSIYHFS